ncbi:hypothetical protein [Mucilaginibacter sp. BT774]|uniref:hypothetical protein n=1 Tax=Mucilaginibacter sp. BT774 TaxID=3062276 RepID=UPI002675EAF6|nr:hypothetical protein [Mucilaginibacter sp. BT774]MDO3624968.1 hypothetical protein [Mucilaginibacter sp. BT774]
MNDQYKGMTVNERLYVAGLMNEFDKAVDEKDIEKVISILKQVDLDTPNTDVILKHHDLIQ